MVVGPGGCRFGDNWRPGLPLLVLSRLRHPPRLSVRALVESGPRWSDRWDPSSTTTPPTSRPASSPRPSRCGARFTAEITASPLAKTPHDLRHAAVSTWLNGGVPPTTVAEWTWHSVEVLLRIYAKCLDGGDALIRHRVQAAPGHAVTDIATDAGTNRAQMLAHSRT